MKKQKTIVFANVLFIIILLIVAIYVVWSAVQVSINKSESISRQIAENYKLKDDKIFTEYNVVLEIGSYKIESMREEGKSIDDIHEWMKMFTNDVVSSNNLFYTDLYGVFDGVIVNGAEWNPDWNVPWTERQWYIGAVNSKGKVYYSDIYTDIKTGEEVITLSKLINDTDVVCVDVSLKSIRELLKKDILNDGNIYVSFDRNGKMIGHKCWEGSSCNHDENYFSKLLEEARYREKDTTFRYKDFNDVEQLCYVSSTDTGWLSVASVTYRSMELSVMGVIRNSVILIAIYCSILGIFMWRNYKSQAEARNTQKILYFVGNTYYAIYLINVKNDTCSMIKPSSDVLNDMGYDKTYTKLISVLSKYVEPEAKDEFCQSFGIENVRKLMDNKIKNFGGDFKRKFSDEYKWVNIQLLFDDNELHKNQAILAFKLIDKEKLKEIEQKKLLEESLVAAQTSSKAKNDFLSNMSHDMRTPLNAIIGLSELAEMKVEKNSEVCEYLKKINFSSKHLLALINDILDMAKIEQGKIELKEENFDIINLVSEIVSVFRKQNNNRTINLIFDLENKELKGDTLRISQILNNLISNAIKFSSDDGVIDISVIQSSSNYREYGVYQFIIKDNGIGMSEEFLKRIFMPFEREERFVSGYISGTGLGMPIVKNIVNVMNGKIDVKSKIGEGTEFTITIPLHFGENENKNDNENVKENNDIKSFDLTDKNILLVEDNEINMEITTELLEMYGANVCKAWNGQEAVEIFENSDYEYFDAILMDMQMPVLDGCGATEKIRALDREDATNVPIIAVTANAFSDDIAKSMKAGMNAHVPKPIDFNVLIKILEQYI